MSYNPKSLFSKIQEKEQTQAAHSGSFSNPLLFKPKVNSTYALRLLWLAPEKGFDREYPMINSYIHRVWDDNAANGQKDHKVICPTSQYIMGETKAAFNKCPICEATSKFYNDGKAGSESSAELYKTFRRTCVGYVPVYVVNGPEEDLHQIRILQYGKQFKDFFDRKIFGIIRQSKNNQEDIPPVDLGDEAIGLEAFMYYDTSTNTIITEGYDLMITTTAKRMMIGNRPVDMPQYQLDFTRRKRNITEIDGIDLTSQEGINYFESLNSSVLHFDQEFYIKSTDAELQEFKLNYITKQEINSTEVSKEIPIEKPKVSVNNMKAPVINQEENNDIPDEIPMGNTSVSKIKSSKSNTTNDAEEIPRTANGDIDIDALIDGL